MISMKDIAMETGVSRATVSYVLNGRYRADLKISEPVVRKVRAAAERMGYVRNKLVKSIVSGESRVIAIISPFPDYLLPTIKGCAEEAARHDCLIKLIPLTDDINQAVMQAVEFRVAGIFAISLKNEVIQKVNPKFFSYGIPSIGLTPNSGRMAFDQTASSRRGTEYLIAQGHRRIVFLGGKSPITSERAEGYREAMRDHHLSEEVLLMETSSSAQEEREMYERVIRMRPAAVQCSSDRFALNLMNACYKRKLFIPDWFSVLGFGNLPGSAVSSPHLTTVNEPYYETGRVMFRRIYRLIYEGKETEPEKLIGEVIERDSVKAFKSE